MFNLHTSLKSDIRMSINDYYFKNELDCINNLLDKLQITPQQDKSAQIIAENLITIIREKKINSLGVDSIMNEFKLSTVEGIALMCLAESLLRIPDEKTQDELIKDKIINGNWINHTKSGNLFVNASSWGLILSGKLYNYTQIKLQNSLTQLIKKLTHPIIRKAMKFAVHFMGNQFVMGENINQALNKSIKSEAKGYQFSYDMLGEAALTNEDAIKYMQSYKNAIINVGKFNNDRGIINGPGISVKLSAIHSQYKRYKKDVVITELYPRLKELFILAKDYNIGLFIDAEESERLELSIDLLEMLIDDVDLKDYNGIGFVIQAYQKRSIKVIEYINQLILDKKRKIMVRLVKGAYWDSEIKKSQIDGMDDYPVFTRKLHTDLSYIVCAQELLKNNDNIYPLFATHNAYTIALINQLGINKNYEFQCLYGMGELLYDNIVNNNAQFKELNRICRIYAPVGTYETLLAYLVRRLLENGANSSFVHQIVDKNIPIYQLTISPIEFAKTNKGLPHQLLNKPLDIYEGRKNSHGFDLANEKTLLNLEHQLNKFVNKQYHIKPIITTKLNLTNTLELYNPANKNDKLGSVQKCSANDIEAIIETAKDSFLLWENTPYILRKDILNKMADLMEQNYIELIAILVREAGKTITNAINEVREAVDFCRYYSNNIRSNSIARGIIVCISPWNFPLAIFIGEISSALATGNCVIAKPSDQTNIIANYAVNLFIQAGIPNGVLQLVHGSGSSIGNILTESPFIKGVIFTGSTKTARIINKNLASNPNETILIAETGGQNAMIVDSTALPEQVVLDVISSGFDSAGQRCSALRVLYLQNDIADKIIHMIKGAMQELTIGSTMDFAIDIGPVIDETSKNKLIDHIIKMKQTAKDIYQTPIINDENGYFVPPTLIEIDNIRQLEDEVFGPVVHIIRYENDQFDNIIDEINSTGFGLTCGIHSRIEKRAKQLYHRIKAGNIYINRNMIGAVVGVQPFGGEGLSGTGPKAGGPLYLERLVINPEVPFNAQNILNATPTKINNFIIQLTECGVSKTDIQELLKYALNIGKNILLNKKISFTGPTGEDNFMIFEPRGNGILYADNIIEYSKQIICCLTTNNIVYMIEDDITSKFKPLVNKDINIVTNITNIYNLNFALISNNVNDQITIKQNLANRNGSLVVVFNQLTDTSYYPICFLTTERTISNNTTATGGNIELISLGM
jgi:RHH-type proline utilization regulon transcriptional repressor/proline dehydrogenase/delta 1-pyrroline-5-carboxylate dehydrogenase